MYCCNCGQKIEDGTKFCPRCGTKVLIPAETASPTEPETYTRAEIIPPEVTETPEVPEAEVCAADAASDGFTAGEEPVEPVPEVDTEPETPAASEDVPAADPYAADTQGDAEVAASGEDADSGAEEAFYSAENDDTTPASDPAPVSEPDPVYAPAETFGPAAEIPAPVTSEPQNEGSYIERCEEEHVSAVPVQMQAPDEHPIAEASMKETKPAKLPKPEKPAKVKKAKKAKKVKPVGKLGVGHGFLAVFLTALLFVSLLASTAATVAALFFTEDGLENVAENVDIKTVKVKNGDKSVTVSELIYNLYHESNGGQDRPDLSEDVIDSLLDEKVVSDLAAELLEDYRSYFVDGGNGSGSGISAKKIAGYIDDNKAEFGQALKNAGYENDVDALTGELSAMFRDIDIEDYSIKSLEDDHSALMTVVSFVLSKVFLILSWVITAVLLILLICTTKRRVSAMLSFIGAPILALGLLFCAASVAGVLLPMFYDNGIVAAAVNTLVYPVLLFGAAAVFLGMILIIIGSSIKSHRKKVAAEAAQA